MCVCGCVLRTQGHSAFFVWESLTQTSWLLSFERHPTLFILVSVYICVCADSCYICSEDFKGTKYKLYKFRGMVVISILTCMILVNNFTFMLYAYWPPDTAEGGGMGGGVVARQVFSLKRRTLADSCSRFSGDRTMYFFPGRHPRLLSPNQCPNVLCCGFMQKDREPNLKIEQFNDNGNIHRGST